MTMEGVASLRRPLTAALLLALVLPGAALAQATADGSERERALEQRVAELERQVQLLLSAQTRREPVATTPTPAPSGGSGTEAARVAAPIAVKSPIQLGSIVPKAAPGTTFSFGGFIKADFLATRTGAGQYADDATGRSLYLPRSIPVGGSGSNEDYNAHAKFSRINFAVDSVGEHGDKAGAMVELDFFGNALGNQTATNTYGATLRHAYMYWNGWLAGQTWSNFMDAPALPEAGDFVGVTDGVVFTRQTQLRYTRGGFSIALENPETTLFSRNAAGVVSSGNSDRGALPDLSVRYGWKGDWGTFGVAALARRLELDNQSTGAKATAFGGGLTVGGKWQLGGNDSLSYQLTGGEGIARYIGLGVTQDAAYDLDRDELDTIGVVAGYLAWRHQFGPRLRTTLMYSRSDYDHDQAITGIGDDVTKTVQSVRGNVFYSPLPKVDIGAELMYGKREIESGAEGDITRLQFTTKYSF